MLTLYFSVTHHSEREQISPNNMARQRKPSSIRLLARPGSFSLLVNYFHFHWTCKPQFYSEIACRCRYRPHSSWCERGDSNPHGFTRQILSLVRLPIPPLSHCKDYTKRKGTSCTNDLHRARFWAVVHRWLYRWREPRHLTALRDTIARYRATELRSVPGR
jgi:hypothetical protein